MRFFTLSPRLKLCAEFVKGDKIADIGTDHAYLPIYLAQSGKITSAVAADINPEPLNRGELNIIKYNLSDIISVRLSDGLKNIEPDEVTDIIVAGMGGELIAKIIFDAPWTKDSTKRLILQPMSRPEYLREFLYNNGYNIQEEKCVISENRLYSVLCAVYADAPKMPSATEKYIGRIQKSDDIYLYNQYLKKVVNYLKQKAQGYEHCENSKEYNKITKIIKELET
ncbi:MAG: class I SAM-dependent methyltransferase [Clostridiales bacterium]|nr:class I SAM-dependent methyltransferase [Clostridiales bacterium]